jgi:4-hydroxybenzoate polyprenyltransferase
MTPSRKRPRPPPRIPAPRIPRNARATAGRAQPEDRSTRAARVLDWLLRPLPPKARSKAHDYLVLTRMDRPVGALLLLWACWWALWLAAGDFPPLATLAIFTVGVFVMRMAGCAINDFADRKLDPQVRRTAGRPLASGRVKPWEALVVFGVLLLVAFGLVLLTNPLTVKLSFAGAALAAFYPFTKRYTHLPQVVLGAAFGWSIPMAFAAVTNDVPPLAWLLFLGNVLWSTIYDTEYAMVDRDDDLRVGAKSTAILFGTLDRPIIGLLMATFALTMLMVGQRAHLGWPYWLALLAACGLFVWQQRAMRDRSREHCLAAFRNNNWVGLLLWAGIALALAIRP